MKVSAFIEWLKTQDQSLEVSVVEYAENGEWNYGEWHERHDAQAVCFDDPQMQATITKFSLILGVEK